MQHRVFALAVPLVLGVVGVGSQPVQAQCSSYGSIGVSCTTPRYTPRTYDYDFRLDTYGGLNYWEMPWYNQSGVNTWVSPSPTFTVSDPAELSSDVTFSVAEGMSAAVNTVNDGFLNVRSGAGLDSPVIYILANRIQVTLSGETDGGWVQLRDGGWVHSDYLKPL